LEGLDWNHLAMNLGPVLSSCKDGNKRQDLLGCNSV
jgi:hypothetical protein